MPAGNPHQRGTIARSKDFFTNRAPTSVYICSQCAYSLRKDMFFAIVSNRASPLCATNKHWLWNRDYTYGTRESPFGGKGEKSSQKVCSLHVCACLCWKKVSQDVDMFTTRTFGDAYTLKFNQFSQAPPLFALFWHIHTQPPLTPLSVSGELWNGWLLESYLYTWLARGGKNGRVYVCRSRLTPLNKERCTRYGQAFPAQHIVASELRSVGGKQRNLPRKPMKSIFIKVARQPDTFSHLFGHSLWWWRVVVCALFDAPPTFFVFVLQLHCSGAPSLKNNNKTHPTRVDLKLMNVLSFFFSAFPTTPFRYRNTAAIDRRT